MYPGGQWYSISNCTCGISIETGEFVLMIAAKLAGSRLKALSNEAYFAAVVEF